MLGKICSFIGYTNPLNKQDLQNKLERILLPLIYFDNYYSFLFYSNTEFEQLAYNVVSKLKKTFPKIKRIAYITSENEKNFAERIFDKSLHFSHIPEEIKNSDNKIIDISNYCIFYLDERIYAPLNYRIDNITPPLSNEDKLRQAYYYAQNKNLPTKNVY